jgi:hypothetical protein
MKRFKVKKHKKRPYRRKVTPTSSMALSRTAILSIVPAIIVGIGLFTTLIVNYNILDKYQNVKFTLPALQLPAINLDWLNTAIQPKDISFSLPQITLATIQFSLPQITLPTIDFTGFITTLQLSLSIALTTATTFLSSLLSLFSLLNPVPFLQILAKEIKTLFAIQLEIQIDYIQITTAMTVLLIQTFLSFLVEVSLGTYLLLVELIHLILIALQTVTEVMIHSLSIVGESVKNILVAIALGIQTAILAIIQLIANVCIFTWQQITNVVNAIIALIKTPFILLGKLLAVLSPYIHILTKAIAKSTAELQENITTLANLAASFHTKN